MSNTPQGPPRAQSSTRAGTTITSAEYGLHFQVPAAWVRWQEQNPERPSLHLAPAELDAARDAEGEWDREFAQVVNAILPFERCVAHVGAEGWGRKGISYADLQVRAYVLEETPGDIEARAATLGTRAVASFAGSPPVPLHESEGEWKRTVLRYQRTYWDYGATAIVDLRVRPWPNHTVAFAFMYTDHADHQGEIEALLASVTLADG